MILEPIAAAIILLVLSALLPGMRNDTSAERHQAGIQLTL